MQVKWKDLAAGWSQCNLGPMILDAVWADRADRAGAYNADVWLRLGHHRFGPLRRSVAKAKQDAERIAREYVQDLHWAVLQIAEQLGVELEVAP